MNKKVLLAQKARHGMADWEESQRAYDSIATLTTNYNRGFRNGGKWKGFLDFRPRRLPVFLPIPQDGKTPAPTYATPLVTLNGTEYTSGKADRQEGLGYEEGAVLLKKGKRIGFVIPDLAAEKVKHVPDSVIVEVCLLPNHPIEGSAIRFRLQVDDWQSPPCDYATHGRSEEWK